METLGVGLVATATFPLPPPTHTGDVVILDLARALDELGHEVDLYAPATTERPGRGHVFPIPASWGKGTPMPWELEQWAWEQHQDQLHREDIVHDFSATKRIAENLFHEGRTNAISTLLGGVWSHPDPPWNIVVWSEAMRERGLRGATDYESTPTPELGGPPQKPIRDAHVVYGGVDTERYSPGVAKEDTFLWMNRWHPAKGYRVAIELARRTGIPLVMAGDHPDDEMFDFQRACALEAQRLAAGLPNVRFEWLPSEEPYHHQAKLELYRAAKALLYTVQFQEPFGLSQVEALACGTPVIGIGYGSVPEIVSSGVTGFVCKDDLGDLAIACEAIDGVNPWRCRQEAVTRFDRRIMARAYVEEYRKVLNGEGWGR